MIHIPLLIFLAYTVKKSSRYVRKEVGDDIIGGWFVSLSADASVVAVSDPVYDKNKGHVRMYELGNEKMKKKTELDYD